MSHPPMIELPDISSALTEREPGYLLGTVLLFGVAHHAACYRLEEPDGDDNDDTQMPFEELTQERAEELERLWMELYPNNPVQPVTIPGFEGVYFILISPQGA